jgi:hypothetical protein
MQKTTNHLSATPNADRVHIIDAGAIWKAMGLPDTIN